MGTALATTPSRLLEELDRAERELKRLREAVSTQRRALERRSAHLRSFEARYLREVGVLLRELDDWEWKLDELLGVLPPAHDGAGPGDEATMPTDAAKAVPAQDLRLLFREVARRIHPDFASDANDADHRTYLMARANVAYAGGDYVMLTRLLDGAPLPAEAGCSTAERLTAARDQLQKTQLEDAYLSVERAELETSEIALLQSRSQAAAEAGRNLLAELAARVRGSIGNAMARYEREAARPARAPRARVEDLVTAEVPEFRRRFGPR